jgi:DNA-binding response OmpR family regulator
MGGAAEQYRDHREVGQRAGHAAHARRRRSMPGQSPRNDARGPPPASYRHLVLRFRVLGPFQVEDEHGPLPLASARRRALLALLTLNAGRVVAVDRLVDALWGEAPPRTAAHMLPGSRPHAPP